MAAWLVQSARRAYARKWVFLGVAVLAFIASASALGALGLLPDPPKTAPATVASFASPLVAGQPASPSVSADAAEDPVKVAIPAINLSADIDNPDTTNIEALDARLLHGAVRYPTSARLGEEGNVVLFGHSSYLPLVNNPAYKTFNGIQKLRAGDTITVYASNQAYSYAVRSVLKEDVDSAAIPLSVAGRVLTLSTCDSFGKKSERFIVVADFVGSHALSS